MGMDVEAVENVGRQLKQSAASVDTIVGTLDRTVSGLSSVWEGPDAQRFAQSWPTFRKSLLAAQASVAGLGQSALNNASEQREASGASGSGTATLPSATHVGDGSGTAPSAGGNVTAEFNDWKAASIGKPIDVDHAYGDQCVDVVNDYANHLFPGVSWAQSLGSGHNADGVFAAANPQYFDKVSSGPQPGDIICIGPNQYSSVGHVAVVESVAANGQLTVIQQNGANPTGVTYEGHLSSAEMAAVQGYLRPKG